MKRFHYALALMAVFALFSGCEKESSLTGHEDESLEWRADGKKLKENAKLCGDQEVPAVATKGKGRFKYELNDDGTLSYQLSAKHMNANVTQSHIHLAGCGMNGGVVAFLFGPFFPDGVPADGVLAEGVLTDANLRGALAGKTIADLVAQIEAGNAYVNVHSTATPSGEIRGQLGNKDCRCSDDDD